MDVKQLENNLNKKVIYNHRGDTISAILRAIYLYKVDDKLILSAIVADYTGTEYRVSPKDVYEEQSNAEQEQRKE